MYRADTAKNIVQYLETVHTCLVDGGFLVNLGPLMYHWAEQGGEMSVELSLEEVLKAAELVGFDVERHELRRAGFNNHPDAMMRSDYTCAFTTLR